MGFPSSRLGIGVWIGAEAGPRSERGNYLKYPGIMGHERFPNGADRDSCVCKTWKQIQ